MADDLSEVCLGVSCSMRGTELLDGGLCSTTYLSHSPLWSYLIFEFVVESSCTLLHFEENNLLHKGVFITFSLSFGRAAAGGQAGEPDHSFGFILLPSFDGNW